ncbi:MAG: AmmeMemoRadiSam system radical SAM enzyme [Deltaproteobacteria bacterium]|nr:AmmeMemoRadiSam system radical SAM enzyme [Deltaproteobacteria bacterium]
MKDTDKQNFAPGHFGRFVREARYYEAKEGKVHCLLCPHNCVLKETERGRCRTREVRDGKLYIMAYGNACSVCTDPVEKKPLNHFLPGTGILSIATGGCNLRCPTCQNAEISQARPEDVAGYDLPPEKVVSFAVSYQVPSIAYTYTDPLAYYEYAYDTAVLAREAGIKNVLVTAGYFNQEPLKDICRYIDAAHVDLKAFNDEYYRQMPKIRLKPVLDTIEKMKSLGVWVELIHLMVPTYTDDIKEISEMCKWIVNTVGAETPIHFSRFHPAYQLLHLPVTPEQSLRAAYQVAKEVGLHYVYVGNINTDYGQNTCCPQCQGLLIRRQGYSILENNLRNGCCPCGKKIAGIWM